MDLCFNQRESLHLEEETMKRIEIMEHPWRDAIQAFVRNMRRALQPSYIFAAYGVPCPQQDPPWTRSDMPMATATPMSPAAERRARALERALAR
jgi:hypothetical protein